jgi:hypothetical protein
MVPGNFMITGSRSAITPAPKCRNVTAPRVGMIPHTGNTSRLARMENRGTNNLKIIHR